MVIGSNTQLFNITSQENRLIAYMRLCAYLSRYNVELETSNIPSLQKSYSVKKIGNSGSGLYLLLSCIGDTAGDIRVELPYGTVMSMVEHCFGATYSFSLNGKLIAHLRTI